MELHQTAEYIQAQMPPTFDHDESIGEAVARGAILRAISYMNKLDWVLDIGAQTGVQQLVMREHGIRNTIGLDLYPNRALEKGIALIKQDMHELPFNDDAFDFVYSRDSLEHSPYPERVIAEIVRVLRPGGRVFLSVPIDHTAPYHFTVLSAEGWRERFSHPRLLTMAEWVNDPGGQYTLYARKW